MENPTDTLYLCITIPNQLQLLMFLCKSKNQHYYIYSHSNVQPYINISNELVNKPKRHNEFSW